jgi:hypothetical protein
MSVLKIEYDPWRGGFAIEFGPLLEYQYARLFGWLNCQMVDSKLAGLICFGKGGGWKLPDYLLGGVHVKGTFALGMEELDLGRMVIKQSGGHIELWYGWHGAVAKHLILQSLRNKLPSHEDIGAATALWMDSGQIFGMRFGFSSLAAQTPFDSVYISPEDVK